jgi:pantothenate kinase
MSEPASGTIGLDELSEIVRRRNDVDRTILAIAGPPGAGKSHIADALAARLNREADGSAAVLPLDGFHFDDLVLVPRELRARKGAPETFDVAGFRHTLMRLRRNQEEEIAVPVFDRNLEIARAAARIIPRSVHHLIVEGNYLLLDIAPWLELRPLFDITVMLSVPEPVLRQRLTDRWLSHGISEAEIAEKVGANDLPNGRLVMSQSGPADYLIRSG